MNLFRPAIDAMQGYVPGEQPRESGWIKLNTNENPYPPSPAVTEAIQRAATDRLNTYPDPLATELRGIVGGLFGVDSDWVLPANGSDENLTMLMRTFVDADEVVSSPWPSYILYETLAEIQAARHKRLVLRDDWSWDFEAVDAIVNDSRLVFVPNPNSPSGNVWDDDEVRRLIPPGGVLVLDEAYGDFRDDRRCGEILHQPDGARIVVTRTLSKSYSLAGIRCGFAVAHPDLIAGMLKVKDSYNCNRLTLSAAAAALRDQAWMLANVQKIKTTRTRLTAELRKLGFAVVESQANFVWATHSEHNHHDIYQQLKQRRILVRYMNYTDDCSPSAPARDGIRVTIGTDAENDALLDQLRDCL